MTSFKKPSASHIYENLNEAAFGLLADACDALNTNNLKYVIAGGWVPVLRTEHPYLRHPGTRDVDVLFNDDKGQIEAAAKNLLNAGYIASAKHEFQLLKKLTVAGQCLIFNVDLMHPAEVVKKGEELFEDILDLGVKQDYDPSSNLRLKSICFASSQIVFDQNLWSTFDANREFSSTSSVRFKVPLMDESALILSKCESANNIKRKRDAFDIYFVLTGKNGQATASNLKELAARFPQVKSQLIKLRDFLDKEPHVFNAHVSKYGGDKLVNANSAEEVKKILF